MTQVFICYSTARSNVRAICERLIDEICFTVLLPFSTLFFSCLCRFNFYYAFLLFATSFVLLSWPLNNRREENKVLLRPHVSKEYFTQFDICMKPMEKSDCCWLHNLKVSWLLNLSRHHKSHHWFVNARNELNNLFDCIADYLNRKSLIDGAFALKQN